MFSKIWHHFKELDYKLHLVCGFLVRLLVIQYGRYHDENFSVPFTDIDYKVFTDAARHVLNGTSPYNRHTYRYTPLISILLAPNILLHICFGKLLFSVIDLAVASLIRLIVKNSYKEYESYKQRQSRGDNKLKLNQVVEEKQAGKRQGTRRRKKHRNVDVKKTEADLKADVAMMFWLYNPVAIAIATRGNCDAIAGLLVLLALYMLQSKRWPFWTGFVHGIGVHVRLYPIAYSLAFFMYLSKYSFYSADYRRQKVKKQPEVEEAQPKAIESKKESTPKVQKRNKQQARKGKQDMVAKTDGKAILNSHETKSKEVVAYQEGKKQRRTIFKKEYLYYLIPNIDQMKLIIGTMLSFGLLTGLFYLLYGYEFLYEGYIYHVVRKDTRHNFSLYFYLQYLTAGIKNIGLWQKLLMILPQIVLHTVFAVRYGLNRLALNFGVLAQTVTMVTYNSVLTSQYFVWILAVLPLSAWQIKMSGRGALALAVIWGTAQAAWLLPAYLLEFHGHNTFLYVWAQSVSFFCANMAILGRLVKNFMAVAEKE